MSKTEKNLRIAIVVLFSVALAMIIAGTAVMYCDEYVSYDYSYYYHDYTYYYHNNPEAGIMPTIALLLVIVGFVLFFVGKKKPKDLIGTIVLLGVAIVLLGLSGAVIYGEMGYIGWCVCDGSIGPCFANMVMTIILLCITRKNSGKSIKAETKTAQSKTGNADKNDNINVDIKEIFDILKKSKELYDAGILTEQEYVTEKENLLKKIK